MRFIICNANFLYRCFWLYRLPFSRLCRGLRPHAIACPLWRQATAVLVASAAAHQGTHAAVALFLRQAFRHLTVLFHSHASLGSLGGAVTQLKIAKALAAHIPHRHRPVHPGQGAAAGVHHRIKDRPLIAELHFQLGRVDIHIHLGGIYHQVDNTPRELAHHDVVAVAFLHRRHDGNTFHIAIVDEKVLHAAGGPAAFRPCQVAADPDGPVLTLHRDESPAKFIAIHRKNGRQQVAAAGGGQLYFPIPDKLKRDFRVRKRQPIHQRCHRCSLGAVLLQKFHPGRDIVEEIFCRDGGSHRAARLRQLSGALPGQRVPRPDLLGRRAGQYLRFAHRADGGQRLPAEAQRPDAVKILRAQHLAGGMPQECLWHILPLDAAAVIGHTDEPYPAVSDLHRDGGRPGID